MFTERLAPGTGSEEPCRRGGRPRRREQWGPVSLTPCLRGLGDGTCEQLRATSPRVPSSAGSGLLTTCEVQVHRPWWRRGRPRVQERSSSTAGLGSLTRPLQATHQGQGVLGPRPGRMARLDPEALRPRLEMPGPWRPA